MATTKNAMLRYQVLDRCFRNPGRKYFWQDLLEECNNALYSHNGQDSSISKRTLLGDIKFMESRAGWEAPIEKYRDNKRVYYRYEDLSFSINNQPLNETEINQLQSALLVLNRFQGLPQFEWMEALLPRLQKGVEPNQISPIFHFDNNPFLKGKELIGQLFNHILYKKVLKVEYKDYKSDASYTLIFHPYLLKEFNNRWFLLGLNPDRNIPNWNLALDRILNIKEQESIAYIPSNTDWQEYFDDIIGVTKLDNEQIENIELWFHPETAPYILSKPIHGSQKKISLNHNGLLISIQVIPNYELIQQILLHGNKVKIVSPKNLQQRLLGIVKETVGLYEE